MKYILSVFLWALASVGFAETAVESPIRMILPINATVSPMYNLIVSIPKGYKALQDLEAFEKASLIEFVPTDESDENWSEIITIHKLIGKKISANDFMQKFKTKLLEKKVNNIAVEDSYETFPNYQMASLLASYEDAHQHETLGAKYYSGPLDCVGVQYTIRDNDDKKAAKKIESFFKTAISLSK